jgi:Subtilase family/Secretion system C-terminal sorting domain
MKRKLNLVFTLLFCLGLFFNAYSQTKEEKAKIIEKTRVDYLLDFAKEKSEKYKLNKAKALELAKEKGWIISKQIKGGNFMELQGVTEDGRPLYYFTHNADAAISTAADKVYSGGGLGLDLDGTGMIAGEWDGGDVLTTHQEFNNTGSSRITDKDGVSSTHYHATHVAGTIMAGGVEAAAKGMAYNANLDAYDWTNDNDEMAAAAAAGLLISNHSYGYGAGWSWTGSEWEWYGTEAISTEEDYQFGFYSSYCADLDDIASSAPYYLIVKSSGNDQGDGAGQAGHPVDGGADGFDCISYKGNAKNILTVGAVNDVFGGYTVPGAVSLASFSSTGPCDDGRIKPDIVGNGVNLYSTYDNNNTAYNSISGTSMSSPNVTGSLLLLQEHFNETFGSFMKAATLKAIAIHTADECGASEGPDYKFGWGLLNTGTAASVISKRYSQSHIEEETYSGTTYTLDVTALGTEPLVVTIVWSDPAGTPVAAALDPTDIMLVNDLDMSITGTGGPYSPYMLSAANPAAAATKGDNDVDNVEKIYIDSPTAGAYTISITHEGSITGGTQDFSIIVTGVSVTLDDPVVSTAVVSSIEETTAQSGGNVLNEGNASVTERGIVWSSSENPTLSDNVDTDAGSGAGSYSSPITGLTGSTTYYVRAYATNTNGTVYGNQQSFTTDPPIYDVLFKIKDGGGNSVDGAKLLIGTNQQYTDAQGEATYNLNPGSYSYRVSATDYYMINGSVDVVDGNKTVEVTIISTSIENDIINSSVFNIFPNPTTGKIKIQGEKVIKSKITVFDITGKQIVNTFSENEEFSFDISEYSNGIYVIQIDTGEEVYRQKLIKK